MRNFYRRPVLLIILACGAGLLVWRGQLSRAQQEKSSGKPSQEKSPSVIWKSATTGNEYRVQADRERVYAEWVNIPPEKAKHGASIRSEGLLAGTKWMGVSHSFLPCATSTPSKEPATRWCHLTTRIEFDSVTADQITGRGETLRNFDCQKCKVLETGWADFKWVRKR